MDSSPPFRARVQATSATVCPPSQSDSSTAVDVEGANCLGCGTTNPVGASFCLTCGASLSTKCPECDVELPAGAKFCVSCGHQLDGSRSDSNRARLHQYIPKELLVKLEAAKAGGVQGERRIVTMLFCDVAASTAAAEKLDPEEWADVMNGAFDYLIAPVYRYEGTLARLMGDGILAFFGAPIAHEDDPQRAVLAGLDIVDGMRPYRERVKGEWGLDFEVRVGINTGLVVVGEVGSDLRLEYTALGDAINVAARMEQTAQPGTVQITEDTRNAVAPLFDFEDLGGIDLKGKGEPVQAYRVLGVKETPGRLRGIEGLDAPLIGRERETSVLRALITDLRQGSGQIISVMGEPGLGKSRLIAELRHALVAEGILTSDLSKAGERTGAGEELIAWYEGRSVSYEAAAPYSPFVDLLNGYFGFGPGWTDADKYDAVKAHIADLSPHRVDEIAPFIATLLGVQLPDEDAQRVRYLQPPQVRGRIFEATCELFERLAERQPLVLVFEDLHWFDPTSIDLVERLMEITDRAALMVLGLFRPWRQELSWRFHETAVRDYAHRYTPLALEPLDNDCSRELVANLLHVEDLPEKVRQLIMTKAEGNPFFVEEVIRSLLDTGLVIRENSHWRATQDIETLAVPDRLAGVITARLDRLDEESKRVAQSASVIGREFQFETLADVHGAQQTLDNALTELQRRELILEGGRLPHQDFLFKHALTQETAYGSLLLSRRRELHSRVAECIERIQPDRVGEMAWHFLEAREESRALPYLIDAADRAAGAYSTTEAIKSYTRALEILDTVKDSRLARRAYEGLGGAMTFGGEIPGAVENYHKMLQVAEDQNDLPMQVSALNKLGNL